jgi:hypothetical protein
MAACLDVQVALGAGGGAGWRRRGAVRAAAEPAPWRAACT